MIASVMPVNPQLNSFPDISSAYMEVLRDVFAAPSYSCAPRNQHTRELLNCVFTVRDPKDGPIVTADPERNKVMNSYASKELTLYRSGTNKVEDFGKLSKFWNGIANPDGTINSAYGHLIWEKRSHGFPTFERSLSDGYKRSQDFMRTPWDWALVSLIMDRDSRQAFVRFSLPEHQWVGCKDQVCTMHMHFMIRNDALHSTVVMRSNDVVKGLAYDIRFFASLHECMIESLRQGTRHPYTGEHMSIQNLKPGTYTHIAHSMHMYEADSEIVAKMLGVKNNERGID